MSEAPVKKYVVRLNAEERQTLEALISKGKHPAALVLKARILLKADVSEAGEGWSDSRIVKALDVSPATIYRTRQRLVEEGFEAVLARKHSPNSARPRIFGGAAEAKLIALTCSPPPKGFRMRRRSRSSRTISAPTNPRHWYQAFPAAEARRIAERFEWHYTPKHGSWLNMAETELSVLSGQCLERRIPDKAMLTEETAAWEAQRNKKHAKADWQFTTADARVKLKRLYRQFERLGH